MMLMLMVVAGALAGGGLVLMVAAPWARRRHSPRSSQNCIDRVRASSCSTRRNDVVRCTGWPPVPWPSSRPCDLRAHARQVRAGPVRLGASRCRTGAWRSPCSAAGGVVTGVPSAVLLVGLVAGAAGGWLYARVDLRSDAEKARREFRHALAALPRVGRNSDGGWRRCRNRHVRRRRHWPGCCVPTSSISAVGRAGAP